MVEQVLHFLEIGQKKTAMDECRTIVRMHENDPGVLKACANIAMRCDALQDAMTWIQGAIRLDGRKADYHYDLATVYLGLGSLDAAITSLETVLQLKDDHTAARLKLGEVHCNRGAYQAAVKQFQKAIKADPNQSVPYCWLGVAYAKQGLGQKALSCFAKAVALDPNCATAHYEMAMLHLRDGRLLPSRDYFYKAVSINNDDWRALGNLCMVLRDLGELNEAMRAGHRAAALNPDSFQIWHNLGNVYKDLSQFKAAATYYEKAIKLNDASAIAYTGMGIACHRSGEIDQAINSFETALAYNPSDGTAISNLFNIFMMDCDWEKADHYKRRLHLSTIESLRIGRVPSETPYLNLVRSDDPELNFAVASAWSRNIDVRMSAIRKTLRLKYSRRQKGRLRIGYLSNNFGDHPTTHITRKLYELHDRERFEVFCYSYGCEDSSQYRKAVQEGCDAFIDIRNLSHTDAAKRINNDGVNILVDLVGYMKGERMAIAALRPAPVQVRWLGMAGTTGARFFDYLITDSTVTPQDQSRFYAEKFAYLPHCYQINDNRPLIDRKNYRRADYGLPEDAFVFCCFNTSYKIDADIFSVWMSILKWLPCSVIWLMANSIRQKENLKKAADRSGVNSRRLIFSAKAPKYEHLARLSLADLALDTSRVNGAASTSDALWAGVPVLTLQGKHFASRMTSSILKTVGLHRMTTYTFTEYEKRAVKLAKETDELRQIKSKLMKTAGKSHLFNTEKFVSDLETKYDTIWDQFQKT